MRRENFNKWKSQNLWIWKWPSDNSRSSNYAQRRMALSKRRDRTHNSKLRCSLQHGPRQGSHNLGERRTTDPAWPQLYALHIEAPILRLTTGRQGSLKAPRVGRRPSGHWWRVGSNQILAMHRQWRTGESGRLSNCVTKGNSESLYLIISKRIQLKHILSN